MRRIGRSIGWWKVVRVAAATAVIIVGPGISPAVAGNHVGAVSVFASAPAPGHPFGIAVGDNRVYVSTSAGDFFAGHQNSDNERVFTYDEAGNLVNTVTIDTADNSDMGLFGLALDGNPKPTHKLYVADMNGRILRVDLCQHLAAPEVFSQVPADSGLAGDWMKAMWNDLVFDKSGNLYVPDDKPRIWRVTPDGTASIWFTDTRLTGVFGFAGGPLGGRIDPTDLRADQAHAAAVEPAAEVERHGLAAVPRADDDSALESDAIDRLLERGGTAARVDGDISAAPTGKRAHETRVARRDRGSGAAALGERASERRGLDRDDAGARAPEELRHEKANDPLAEDRDHLAEAGLRVEHVVVVVAARVPCHRARRLGATIVHRDDDRASRRRTRARGAPGRIWSVHVRRPSGRADR